MTATITQQVVIKDENGAFVYDQEKISAATKKFTKEVVKFNAKLAKAHAEGRMKDFSILDVDQAVKTQLGIYMHNFRLAKSVVL